jgi:hypothetical protein
MAPMLLTHNVKHNVVGAGYFATMQIPLLASPAINSTLGRIRTPSPLLVHIEAAGDHPQEKAIGD